MHWTVQVCAWLGSLELSQDYSHVIREHHIPGAVLLTMTQKDWYDTGVRRPADITELDIAVCQLIQMDLEFVKMARSGKVRLCAFCVACGT